MTARIVLSSNRGSLTIQRSLPASQRFNGGVADAIARVIAEDTGLPFLEAGLLDRALAGLAHVSERYWLETSGNLELEVAGDLVYQLAWREISRLPSERES